MSKKLSVTLIANLKPDPSKRVEIPDAGCVGLYLSVTPRGSKTFVFRYRFGGKPKKLTIGPFLPARTAGNAPALGEAHTLSEARAAAVKAGQDVAQGVDPAALKQAVKQAEKDTESFASVLDLFDRRHLSKNRAGHLVRAMLDREALPFWADKKITEITKKDVIAALDRMMDRGSPISANRLRAHLHTFFKFAISRDLIEVNPVAGTERPAPEVSRDRVLTDDEIKLFWKATDALGAPFGPLFKLLLVTGQRRGEVAGMTDKEITENGWTIPGTRTKNADTHTVPLPPLAVEIIEAVPRIKSKTGLLFTTNGETPVSGFTKARDRLEAEMLRIAQESDPEAQIEAFTLHDLRRTAATRMASLRIAPHVVEAVLNHRSGSRAGVAGIYNRFDYADEKRAALTAWASHLLAMTSDAPASNVVPIKA